MAHPETSRRAKALGVGLAAFVGALCAAASCAAGSAPDARPHAQAPQPVTLAPAAPLEKGEFAQLPSFSRLVESVKGAVVNVEVVSHVHTQGAPAGPFSGEMDRDDFWERFSGRGAPGALQPREQVRQGLGSGFLITPDGTILTNNHVVEGAVAIRVKLDDGRTFDAEVRGRDPLTDVAVIRLRGHVADLPHVSLGDSDALRVGEWVLAIGNPFGLSSSVSAGIISARERNIGAGPYDDFLQTDAAINPGNSGGPLFNMKGEVIGINTAIVGGGSGIGFAVPSNLARALLPQLQSSGTVTRGWLGVSIQDLTPDLAKALGAPGAQGAVVADVTRDGPAAKAGLEQDDIITAIDGDRVSSSGALTRKVALKQPGSVSSLSLLRGGKPRQARISLGMRPDLEGVGAKQGRDSQGDDNSGRIGLLLQDVPERVAEVRNVPEGALIAEVRPGSAADRADLRPGMVVTEAHGQSIHSAEELRNALVHAKSGDVLLLRVHAGGTSLLRALSIPERRGS